MNSGVSVFFDFVVEAIAVLAVIGTVAVVLGMIFEEPVKKLFRRSQK